MRRVWPLVFAALAGCSASLCRLTLTWNSTLPSDPWLLSLPNLCNLTLTGAVVTLPKELTALTCLTTLNIHYCTVVSAEGFTAGLVELFLKNTQLSGLPASLSALGRLTDLTFDGVDLSAADLNILWSLASLKTLALTDTCITSLPVSLTALRSLDFLFLEMSWCPWPTLMRCSAGCPRSNAWASRAATWTCFLPASQAEPATSPRCFSIATTPPRCLPVAALRCAIRSRSSGSARLSPHFAQRPGKMHSAARAVHLAG